MFVYQGASCLKITRYIEGSEVKLWHTTYDRAKLDPKSKMTISDLGTTYVYVQKQSSSEISEYKFCQKSLCQDWWDLTASISH